MARRAPLNNASAIAARIHRTRLALFDSVLARRGNQVREAVRRITEAVRGSPEAVPYAVLESLRAR